jgi:surface carbohydrate biosynthesis protein
MNIYLHVEVLARELNNKLLLATLAASRGHQVIFSELEFIEKGLIRGWLPPGIFYTKSLTPGQIKIDRHQALIDSGSKITSIDEESGLDSYGYKVFAKKRYSEKTIDQSSAVFTWGDEDFDILRKNFKKYSNKIHKTGSPRIDLCKPSMSKYWNKPKNIPEKPYLLVASNMAICDSRPFSEMVKSQRVGGYYDRDQELLRKQLIRKSSDYYKAMVFIEAIKYLSKNNNGYDIVFRPHPTEKVEYWNTLLHGIPNLHINNNDSINEWINCSLAVMHHGCTTGIETFISHKPLITYIPPELKDHVLHNNPPNELGYHIKSKEDLLKTINSLNSNFNRADFNRNLKSSPKIFKKIHIDDKELAAEKIIKVWESIFDDFNSRSINLFKIKIFIFKMKINSLIGNFLKVLFPKKFSQFGSSGKNSKFPQLNIYEISQKVEKLKKIFKINKKIECKLISKRTILIKIA